MRWAFLAVGAFVGVAFAQEKVDGPVVRPEIAPLAFLAGDWTGTMEGGLVEEQWSAPHGAHVMGSFRWMTPEGGLAMQETLSITAGEGGVVLRLRHFNGETLAPWASEAAAATTLTLAESGPTRAHFTGGDESGGLSSVTYESSEPASLAITVAFKPERNRPPLEFRLTRRAAAPAAPVTGARAAAAFERFKSLQGKWRGRSTKGWEDTLEYRTIARGSAVMELSFDAHPGETMATFVHPDGEPLLLTHYCVAGNQPRLVLSGVADDGRTLTFSFLDGGNMASRDLGHMDAAVFSFPDDDHFTARWSWYQDGRASWMEDIVHERVKDEGAPMAPKGPSGHR